MKFGKTINKLIKVSVIFGTRPEAIKLAPIILAMQNHSKILCDVCVTAQHREMLDQVLSVFNIAPNTDLNIMKKNQTLAELTSRSITAIDKYLSRQRPDMVLVQGDTTTVFAASLAAFYNKIPLGHVEAGLRTGNLKSPWPEEANRILTTRLATFHFAPTEINRQNLIAEGILTDNIFVTGNTVIDALLLALERVRTSKSGIQKIVNNLGDAKIVLITGHRRENFGEGFESICRAIAKLAAIFPHVHFIYPVHLNPNVRSPVMKILGDKEANSNILNNVHLIDPLPYLSFVELMNRAYIILTDSGGVQEEAPSLGKPVLVMRDTTERPEAVNAGTVKIVGNKLDNIVKETSLLLTDTKLYGKMSKVHNPYGDGKATIRIIKVILNNLQLL